VVYIETRGSATSFSASPSARNAPPRQPHNYLDSRRSVSQLRTQNSGFESSASRRTPVFPQPLTNEVSFHPTTIVSVLVVLRGIRNTTGTHLYPKR
jgi:hypothetical protein